MKIPTEAKLPVQQMKIYNPPEKCPFCEEYKVYHMIPIGDGPTRGCRNCLALWSPIMQMRIPSTGSGEMGITSPKINLEVKEKV